MTAVVGRLAGKVAVVTGASRGIGAEIARLFAAEGARVVGAARTLREGDHRFAGSLEATVGAIRAAGGEAGQRELRQDERRVEVHGPRAQPLADGEVRHRQVVREGGVVRATLLLATEPLDRVTGRVTYSQQILREFGWITEARGRGVDTPGSGYARI